MRYRKDYSGCCFRCPDLASQTTPPSASAQGQETKQLINPWPQLAANPTPNATQTSPLLRATYFGCHLPSIDENFRIIIRSPWNPNPIWQKEEEAAKMLESIYIAEHEKTHFHVLDCAWSPAKDLIRVYLARCYGVIEGWLTGGMPIDHDSIRTFKVLNAGIGRVVKNIEFSEELFAHALTMKKMNVVCRISVRFFLPITFHRTVFEQPVERINTMHRWVSPAR